MARKKITVTINNSALQKRFGKSILIEVDENGTPIDRYWRNRVRDAAIDGCITLAVIKKSQKTSETTKGE